MPKIDTSSWGNFLISDVFETNKKGKSIQVPTGANIQKKDLKNGATPRITVTGFNNGVFGYFEDIPNNGNYRIYENFISVSFLGTVFYQESKASLDMKVHCLKPLCHTLNKYTGEFLVTAILASLKESSYSDQISSTVLPMLSIKLPINSEGNPDWQYMEDYMRNIEVRVSDSISKLESAQRVENSKIDVSGWGKFIVGDLFTIDRGKRQKAQDRVKGDIPYYSASNEANGMTDIIGNPTFTDKDAIIGTTFGDFFYVNGVFSGSDEITIYHHPKVDGNEYIGLFVVSALKQNKHKYSFTSKMFKNRAEKDFIYLPIDSSGEPDWLYMENYMKALETKVSDFLDKTA